MFPRSASTCGSWVTAVSIVVIAVMVNFVVLNYLGEGAPRNPSLEICLGSCFLLRLVYESG